MSADSPWKVTGAAVQGTSHLKRGTPCQDAFGFILLPGGGLACAVADGAGSAKRSERGSKQAVEAALATAYEAAEAGLAQEQKMTAHAFDALLRVIFSRARKAVIELARAEHHWLRDYATTLTVALSIRGWLAVGQIGDGAAVALDEQGEMFSATHLQKGEYANETHFLTGRFIARRVQTWAEQRPIQAFALMSDGLVRLALRLPSGEPHRPFFEPLFSFIQSNSLPDEEAAGKIAGFLASERVCARTDDDKSLVLAAYLPQPALLQSQPQAEDEGRSA